MKNKYILWLKRKRLEYGRNFISNDSFINTIKVIFIAVLTKISIRVLTIK